MERSAEHDFPLNFIVREAAGEMGSPALRSERHLAAGVKSRYAQKNF
jgi:hypothetical protein